MRGRPAGGTSAQGGAGTTPAYAGKTPAGCIRSAAAGDHPRVCGEDKNPIIITPDEEGPPPRMRGRHAGRVYNPDGVGTTPAYAGKTPPGAPPPRSCGDHPRVCGEDEKELATQARDQGPPPRMRGRPGYPLQRGGSGGTTPAYAGKTRESHTRVGVVGDHPRVCGEDHGRNPSKRENRGPPPRMRGRLARLRRRAMAGGTTPAYAGKTEQ